MEILNSSAANGLKKAKNGYTLLELLAVVAILLFIGTIVILRFGIFYTVSQQYMVEELVEILEYLRNDAMINHRQGTIYAIGGQNYCEYYVKKVDMHIDTKTFQLESGWIFENDFRITFTSSGAPKTGGSIYLYHSSKKRIAVTVEPASSMVRVKVVE